MSTNNVLIWSDQHRAWWRPDRAGYTDTISEAGRYSDVETVEIFDIVGPEKQLIAVRLITQETDLCTCMACFSARAKMHGTDGEWLACMRGPITPGWSYACATCGNKRCPHHADHRLVCTASNEPGQPGSPF